MGKIIQEFETEYDVGDLVVFKKGELLYVGIVEGYHIDDGMFWFNIRVSRDMVFSYSNCGDVPEHDIVGKLESSLEENCREIILPKE